MPRTHNKEGKFTKYGAKRFGFQQDNKLGQKFESGKKHWNWKGGYKYYKSGNGKITYRRIKVDNKWVAEHRYIMERHLNIKLDTKTIIHHKDGNGLNNNIDNLELMSWGMHNRTHRKKGGVSLYGTQNKRP